MRSRVSFAGPPSGQKGAAGLWRVNLGCGADPRPGMLNIDLRGPGAQLHRDARDLGMGDGTVEHLQAFHLVEHLGWVGCTHALCEWFRVMVPGATLVIETPDLLQTAREFARSGFGRRAQLANWIYGHETPGMEHRFGFEFPVLRDLLRSCGFELVRRGRPRCHNLFPSLRVTARRGSSEAQLAHARFKREVRLAGLVADGQAIAAELHKVVARDLVVTLERASAHPHDVDAMLARLCVYDLRIARAAVQAIRPLISKACRTRWLRRLGALDVAALPRTLTAHLLSMPAVAGQMHETFARVRDHGVARVGQGTTSARGDSLPCSRLQVLPFSPAGLCAESERRLGAGLRCFVDGRHRAAHRHMLIAARLNSNDPVTFWNLSRLAVAGGDRDLAQAHLIDARRAAERAKVGYLESIDRELRRLAAGGRIRAAPVSPVSAGEDL